MNGASHSDRSQPDQLRSERSDDVDAFADSLGAAVLDPDPGRIARLTGELAARAGEEGLLDVAVRTVDSPIGELLVAVTPVGVVRVAFDREGHDEVLSDLARRVSPRILESSERTDAAARQLGEYFEGTRHDFVVPLDLRLVGGFRRQVVEALGRIPYGTTLSYGELAAEVHNPGAVRAVGSACANNPVPVIVACHRVVRSDGSIGNYLGGSDAKAALLTLESS